MQAVLRWLTVLGTVGVVLVGVVLLSGLYGGPGPAATSAKVEAPKADAAKKPQPAAAAPAVVAQLAAGERADAAPAPALPAAPAVTANPGGARAMLFRDQLQIPDCHVNVPFKEDVPSQRDGVLLYVATEIKPGEVVPPKRIVEVKETYAYLEVQPNEQVPAEEKVQVQVTTGEDKKETKICRRMTDKDEPDANQVIIAERTRRLKKLIEGDEVHEGQLLAMVDPALAISDFLSKKTKVGGSEADRVASVKTRDEAEQRWITAKKLVNSTVGHTISPEEVRGALLTWDRYKYEVVQKEEAIKQARSDLNQALTVLKMHEIRSQINGVIKTVNKFRGEAVKAGEQVLVLHPYDLMRVEGLVDVQYTLGNRLPMHTKVIIEPSRPRSPAEILGSHLQAIRAVAVSKNRRVVSASEDSTHVWDRKGGDVRLDVPASTYSLACSPPGDKEHNLVATGGADGVVRLWNLDADQPALVTELKDGHKGAVNCVAFSHPDGRWIATGGADRSVILWSRDGQQLARLDGHRGEVTSVQFLSEQQIVSAGKDNSMMLWTLDDNGKLVRDPTHWDTRTGEVTTLGVNPKTHQALYDQGGVLNLLDLPSGRVDGQIKNAGTGLNFTNMALFSPDGDLVLTNAASENRLQLWRVPTRDRRAYELVQLVWPFSAVTCGAFSPGESDNPEDNFIVTGTEDQSVVLWNMPGKDEINEELVGEIVHVDREQDLSSRQVRVWADVDNKNRRLYPGEPATMVVHFHTGAK
jgi:WD40 repeat protein